MRVCLLQRYNVRNYLLVWIFCCIFFCTWQSRRWEPGNLVLSHSVFVKTLLFRNFSSGEAVLKPELVTRTKKWKYKIFHFHKWESNPQPVTLTVACLWSCTTTGFWFVLINYFSGRPLYCRDLYRLSDFHVSRLDLPVDRVISV